MESKKISRSSKAVFKVFIVGMKIKEYKVYQNNSPFFFLSDFSAGSSVYPPSFAADFREAAKKRYFFSGPDTKRGGGVRA